MEKLQIVHQNKKMNRCISHNLLITISRSQIQAVFKKVIANPCKGKCYLFRKAWSQALVKGNPKSAPLCFSEGSQVARSGISLLFSACQLQCAQCLQERYQHWVSWTHSATNELAWVWTCTWSWENEIDFTLTRGETSKWLLSSINTLCIYNKAAETG